MIDKQHHYSIHLKWIGNTGNGTANYFGYNRNHEIEAHGKRSISGSSDPTFCGDSARWNPEELLVASLSACHKLWYLGLCSQANIVVLSYEDDAEGIMLEEANGAGQFISVKLHPRITISVESDEGIALDLHHHAHAMCFIARSVNFPVSIEPRITKDIM